MVNGFDEKEPFMSIDVKITKIFMHFSVIFNSFYVDFDTNMSYTKVTTFKEGDLCIERF